MPVRRVVHYPEPVLRQKARKIHRFDPYVQQLLADLEDTLAVASGVGLAAPQIGVPLRAIVVDYEDTHHVVVNPEVLELGGEEIEGEEGCLSIPGWYGPVKRRERVVVRGLNRKGKPVKIKANGWEARIFQHEIDHLDGVLFTDRMDDRSKLHKVESDEEEEELLEDQVLA